MNVDLQKFFAAYLEWLGMRSDLCKKERARFARWLTRAHPELTQGLRSEPAMLRHMCLEVQRGHGNLPAAKGLGRVTLKRHAEPLVKKYLSLPEQTRGTFAAFLERVLQECKTQKALIRFLLCELGQRE